jgi:hypothetical protein
MKGGARVALAVAAGYLLGRTKKMRLALMVAAAGATGSLGGSPKDLLKRGIAQLGSVPELAELTDTVRGELLSAAKAAAVTAASNQITSLSGRLQDGITGRGQDRDEDEADEDQSEDRDTDDRDTEDEDRKTSRRRPKRRTATRRSDSDEDDTDEDDTDENGAEENGADDDGAEAAPRRRRPVVAAKSGSGKSPVRRNRR